MEASYLKIVEEYNTITSQLAGGGVDIAKLGKRQSELQFVVDKITQLKKAEEDLKSAEELALAEDAEMAQLANLEQEKLRPEIEKLKAEIEEALLPRDTNDDKNCIVEIRAGAGGD